MVVIIWLSNLSCKPLFLVILLLCISLFIPFAKAGGLSVLYYQNVFKVILRVLLILIRLILIQIITIILITDKMLDFSVNWSKCLRIWLRHIWADILKPWLKTSDSVCKVWVLLLVEYIDGPILLINIVRKHLYIINTLTFVYQAIQKLLAFRRWLIFRVL